MPFPESVVKEKFDKVGGKCEKCGKQLSWENRGREGRGKWEAHHKDPKGSDTLGNCQILCWDCHKKTL